MYYPSDGILLIRAQKTQVNIPLTISLPRRTSFWGKQYTARLRTHIRQYTIEGHPLYVAIFDRISPGTCHIAYGSPEEKPLADTSIVGGEVTEVDARKLLPTAHHQ